MENVHSVETFVLSQEDWPDTNRTIRQVSPETGISRTSVHRIIHKELQLKCLKKKQAQDLTDANKIARLARTKQLLRKYPQRLVQSMLFTDEKLFTVTPPVNLQNDRVYVAVPMRKRQVAANRLLRIRSNFSKSFMVSVGVSSLGRYSNGQSDASSVMAKCSVCLSPSAFSYHRWLAVMWKGEPSA